MLASERSLKTRRRLLGAAFEVVCRKGFQSAGLNEILAAAGVTKGAIYYHFKDKNELGYAVVDEIVAPAIAKTWIAPLTQDVNSIEMIERVLQRIAVDMDQSEIRGGCPLGNLAAEMSALDEGFRLRIGAVYDSWRGALAGSIASSQAAGQVRGDADPQQVAAFIVAAVSGLRTVAKSGGGRDALIDGVSQVQQYLEQLRPVAARATTAQPAPVEAAEAPPVEEIEYVTPPPGGDIETYLL